MNKYDLTRSKEKRIQMIFDMLGPKHNMQCNIYMAHDKVVAIFCTVSNVAVNQESFDMVSFSFLQDVSIVLGTNDIYLVSYENKKFTKSEVDPNDIEAGKLISVTNVVTFVCRNIEC